MHNENYDYQDSMAQRSLMSNVGMPNRSTHSTTQMHSIISTHRMGGAGAYRSQSRLI